MVGQELSGPWATHRIEALTNTFERLLDGAMDPHFVTAEMRSSLEFLQPMWDVLTTQDARYHLLYVYISPYKFPHTRALHAALGDSGLDLDAIQQISPDGISMSVQLFLEAGFWGEATRLMEMRCETKTSKVYGLDKYFRLQEDVNEWGI